jgi:hypothetical protein
MDIQKEREAFERLPLAELAIKSEYVFYNEETNSYWPNEDFCPSDAPETMNFAWEAWQAAKAQAVPEGFVLIKDDTKTVVAIERMVEQQVEASGMDSRRLERLDGWKIIEAAVKAQEPAND